MQGRPGRGRPGRWRLIAGVAVLALAALALMVWAVTAGPGGRWTAGSVHVVIAMLAGVVGACGLTAGLMWLAFFSARQGFDDRADFRLDDDRGVDR